MYESWKNIKSCKILQEPAGEYYCCKILQGSCKNLDQELRQDLTQKPDKNLVTIDLYKISACMGAYIMEARIIIPINLYEVKINILDVQMPSCWERLAGDLMQRLIRASAEDAKI